MPSGPRIRVNNVYGIISDNPLTAASSTFNSMSLPLIPVVSSAHAVVVLDPKRVYGDPEIVVITVHTVGSTVATILRGQYGTSPRLHPVKTAWAHVPIDEDYTEVVTSTTRPSDPYRGQMLFETDTNKFVARSVTDVWVDVVPLGAWQTWIPIVSQPAAIASTTVTARYTKFGRTVHVYARLNITGAGTAGQSVTINLPVPGFAHGGSGIPVGSGWIFDQSTVIMYEGSYGMLSTGLSVDFASDATAGNNWGIVPSVGLASGDIIGFQLTYEGAS